MSENKNKILVALDGSKRGLKTIKYLCNFKPFFKKEVVLHNVITKVPESYYDLRNDPFSYKATSQVKAWELGYRSEMEGFMKKSRMKLIASGFKPEAISIMIAERNRGIARDIMDEAQKGYDALLIRRRGSAQAFLPVAMGSVSTKLVEKAGNVPIMLSGIEKANQSLFLAVDGSQGAKRAVEFVAGMIKDSDCRVVLCSILRDFDVFDENNKRPAGSIRSAFEEIETALTEARQIIENAGIPKERIVVKIIKGARSRSGAIVEAAKQESCDTIVFGRKGKSDVTDFDIGRIPWKVIQGARKMTVWVVP